MKNGTDLFVVGVGELAGRRPEPQHVLIDGDDKVGPRALQQQLGQQNLPRVAPVAPRKDPTFGAVPPEYFASERRRIRGHAHGGRHRGGGGLLRGRNAHTAMNDSPGRDLGLESVVAWLLSEIRDPPAFFAGVVRKSIDEVLDGPRTGRWDFDRLEKTEKTYVGTKLEILLRTALGLDRGDVLDLEIEGQPVDIKWSKDSSWQIPREAVGQLCLCIGGVKKMTSLQVGVVRCNLEYLNRGRNQDSKGTLSVAGRAAMRMIVSGTPMPPNFVAEMDPDVRLAVMSQPTIQLRVTKLFQSLPGVAIPRDAVRTVARTEGDPMRRVRKDAQAGDPLGGYEVLSKYDKDVIAALGYPPLGKDEFMSVTVSELERVR